MANLEQRQYFVNAYDNANKIVGKVEKGSSVVVKIIETNDVIIIGNNDEFGKFLCYTDCDNGSCQFIKSKGFAKVHYESSWADGKSLLDTMTRTAMTVSIKQLLPCQVRKAKHMF